MTVPLQPPKRIQRNLLAVGEKRLLAWISERLPEWFTPDRLTAIALVAALVIGASYALSWFHPAWLAVAVAGYFVHWFGDSLDGTIARYRGIERPRFGYFIDHSCDGLATLLIIGGIGASPFLRVDVALFAVVAYLLLAVHTFLLAKVSGEFPLSQMGAGPTELRLILIAVTVAMGFLGPDAGRIAGFNAFDLIFAGCSIILLVIFVVQTVRVGAGLARSDAAARKPPAT